MNAEQASAPERVYIGVGANIDPERNIAEALARLDASVGITDVSPFYRTPAIDRPRQPDYLNGVVQVYTDLPAKVLKVDVLRRIETELGRVKQADPYAARPIDLDVLVYGEHLIDDGQRIPDPDLLTRPFLAAGVLALEPDFRLPGSGAALPVSTEATDLVEAVEFSRTMKMRFTA